MRCERQSLLVGGQSGALRCRRHSRRQVALDQTANPAAPRQNPGQRAAVAAEIERQWKAACHVEQPVGQSVGDLVEQECVSGEKGSRTVALAAHLSAIEDDDLGHGGHYGIGRRTRLV